MQSKDDKRTGRKDEEESEKEKRTFRSDKEGITEHGSERTGTGGASLGADDQDRGKMLTKK